DAVVGFDPIVRTVSDVVVVIVASGKVTSPRTVNCVSHVLDSIVRDHVACTCHVGCRVRFDALAARPGGRPLKEVVRDEMVTGDIVPTVQSRKPSADVPEVTATDHPVAGAVSPDCGLSPLQRQPFQPDMFDSRRLDHLPFGSDPTSSVENHCAVTRRSINDGPAGKSGSREIPGIL